MSQSATCIRPCVCPHWKHGTATKGHVGLKTRVISCYMLLARSANVAIQLARNNPKNTTSQTKRYEPNNLPMEKRDLTRFMVEINNHESTRRRLH